MSDIQFYDYEVYTTALDNGQEVLVQIFRKPESGIVLHAQMAFRSIAGDSWSVPYQLEKK